MSLSKRVNRDFFCSRTNHNIERRCWACARPCAVSVALMAFSSAPASSSHQSSLLSPSSQRLLVSARIRSEEQCTERAQFVLFRNKKAFARHRNVSIRSVHFSSQSALLYKCRYDFRILFPKETIIKTPRGVQGDCLWENIRGTEF